MKKVYLFGMILFGAALSAHAQVPEKVAGAVVEGALTGTAVKAGTQAVAQEAIGATVGKTIGAGMGKSVAADRAGAPIGKAVAGTTAGATVGAGMNAGAAKIPVKATKTTGTPLKKVEPYLTREQVALTKIKAAVSYEPAQTATSATAEKVIAAEKSQMQAQLAEQAAQSNVYMHNRQLANQFLPQLERVPSFAKVSEADYQKIYGGTDYTAYETALQRVEDLQKELAAAVRVNKGTLTVDQRDHHFFFELDENVAFAWKQAAKQMPVLDPAMQQAYQTMQKMGSYLNRVNAGSDYTYHLKNFYQLRPNDARGVDEFFLGTPVTIETTLANPLTGATKVKFTKVKGLPVPKKLHVVIVDEAKGVRDELLRVKELPQTADWTVETKTIDELKNLWKRGDMNDVDVLIGDFTAFDYAKMEGTYLIENMRKDGYEGLVLTSTRDNPYYLREQEKFAEAVALKKYADILQYHGVDGTLGVSWWPLEKDAKYGFEKTATANTYYLGHKVLEAIQKASYFKGGGRGSLALSSEYR